MIPKRNLILDRADFDLSALPTERQGSGESALREGIANYVRQQFARLGGIVEALVIDAHEIRVTWSPDPREPAPAQTIVAMLQKGQSADAIVLMQLLLSDDPDNPTLLYNLGMARSDLGQLESAVSDLRRLMALEPGNVNGRVALGVALTRQGNLEEAADELRRAVADDPANPWAHRNLGACLMKLGQASEAVEPLRKATELNPRDDRAWLGLAQALEMTGDDASADAAYLRVLELDEFGDTAELARQARSQISQRGFRAARPQSERMDAVMYCLSALEKFEAMPLSEVQKIGTEIAILGRQGLDVNNPVPQYHLRSLPGEFSGLHLVCLMYVAFQKFAPEHDLQLDLAREYQLALRMHQKKSASDD